MIRRLFIFALAVTATLVSTVSSVSVALPGRDISKLPRALKPLPSFSFKLRSRAQAGKIFEGAGA